ncbi:MAG: 50S ribosomal protein L11 methyltransferase [Bacteroidales bacterium]|nr:50S ribosomal protein L11 methyltransferase [Bacteroidales bacterium]
MKYTELSFLIQPYNEAVADVLTALLADVGCDTFVPGASGLTAYILQDAYDESAIQKAIRETAGAFAFSDDGADLPTITFTATAAPDENWNAVWEAEHHFEPIFLPDGQQIRVIPRQAFGSGEHSTTRMMIAMLSETALPGACVIDAGCGTGILGIAALKLGASSVFAYDIDEWSVKNAQDNFALNGCAADIVLGDASCLSTAPQTDILLANINRNILLADLPVFVSKLKPGGCLLLSGFYEADVPLLMEKALSMDLHLTREKHDGEWRALTFQLND